MSDEVATALEDYRSIRGSLRDELAAVGLTLTPADKNPVQLLAYALKYDSAIRMYADAAPHHIARDTKSSPSTAAALSLSHEVSEYGRLQPTYNALAVFQGFSKSAQEDSVYTDVIAALAGAKQPTDADKELSIVHPFMHDVMSKIADSAKKHGAVVNKAFHEHVTEMSAGAAVGDLGGRVDWVFTAGHEQCAVWENSLFYLEAKPVARAGYSPNSLVREGQAQVMRRLARRHREVRALGLSTTHGVGMVTNGLTASFLRIDFTFDRTCMSPLVPCYSTHEMPFLHPARDSSVAHGGAGAGTPAASSMASRDLAVDSPTDGLRYLIRLMLEPDAAAFGLPPIPSFTPGEGFTMTRLLGSGGFGRVCEYTSPSGEHVAFKCARNHSADVWLDHEAKLLRSLESAGVPRVPHLLDVLTSTEARPRRGLLTKPVGVPLLHYIAGKSDAQRSSLADRLWAQLHSTLRLAHSAGVLHGDVRPSNIIVVGEGEEAAASAGAGASEADGTFVLIDWGAGWLVDSGDRQRKHLFGVRAFMSDRLLRLKMEGPPSARYTPLCVDDIWALLYTCAAVAAGVNGSAPWATGYSGSDAISTLIKSRREMLLQYSKHHKALAAAVNDAINAAQRCDAKGPL